MKTIFIRTSDGVYYYMDAVFQVVYSQTGTPSEYAMESGVKASDHYSQNNDTVSISGSVSKAKLSTSDSTELEILEKGLTALKKSGEYFELSFSDNLDIMTNCLFTDLSMTRSTETGKHCIDLQMTISKVVTADRANLVSTPVPAKSFADIVDPKKKGAGNSVEPSSVEKASLVKTFNSLLSDSYLAGVVPSLPESN